MPLDPSTWARKWRRGMRMEHLPWLLVILGPIALFGPMLVRGEVLVWGTPILQFTPWRDYAYSTLTSGHLPLWNPLLGMGAPLLANYQSALLYPPNFILAITGPAWGQGLLVALHLIWAGWGMILLVRRIGLGYLAQGIAGVSFSMSGYLVARGSFLSINATAAWLPWILIVADRLVHTYRQSHSRKEIVKSVLQMSLVFCLQWMAGHAQTAWYTLLFAVAWVLWRTGGEAIRKDRIRLLATFGVAGMIAFLLSAVQLIPTLEYLLISYRAESMDPGFALTYSFWPWRLLGLFMPDLFGNPAHGNYWGYGNFWEDAIYIGVLSILLALYGMRHGMRRGDPQRSVTLFFMVTAAVAFLFALGKNTPVFTFLFEHIPTFNLFQAPTRWNLLTVFALSVLAGLGAESWQRPTGKALYWTRLGTAGSAIIGAAAWFGAHLLGDIEISFVRAFALAGLWFVVSGILTLRRSQSRGYSSVALAGLAIVLDLYIAGVGLNPSAPASVFEGRSNLVTVVGEDHRLYMDSETEYVLKFEKTHRFDAFSTRDNWERVRDLGLPNTNMLDGVRSANNFDPILTERYVRWMEALGTLSGDRLHDFLKLMDVSWQVELDPASERHVRYRSWSGAARVRLISSAEFVDSPDAALETMMRPELDLSRTLILEGEGVSESNDGTVIGKAFIKSTSNPNEIHVYVDNREACWLLLSDLWYPGWKATVDGIEAELLHADYAFKAVRFPAGEHTVVFRYIPISFYSSAVVSGLVWLVFIILGLRWTHD